MTTYFVVILTVMIFCYLAQKSLVKEKISNSGTVLENKKTDMKIFLFIVIAVLVFVAGFRYYVGTDYGGYILIYQDNAKTDFSFKQLFDITNENGFYLLCKLCDTVFGSYVSMFVVVALLTITPFLISSYKETDDFLFVALMYIFSGCWSGSFNGMRQYLAATIIYLGRHYIQQKKFLKYVLICFVAFLFHRSAIFGLLFYFVYSESFNVKKLSVIVLLSIILALNYETIFNFIGWLKDKEFVLQENGYTTRSVNFLRVLVQCCPAVLTLYLAVNKRIKKEQAFYAYMTVVNATVYLAMSNSAYLSRLGIFTGCFLPIALNSITKSISKRYYKVFRYLIVLFYFLFWIYEIYLKYDLKNFRFVFNYL